MRVATGWILAGPTSSPLVGCRTGSIAAWPALMSRAAILRSLTGILQDPVSTRSQRADHSDLACGFLEQKAGTRVEVSRPSVHYSGPVLKVLKRNVKVPYGRCLRMWVWLPFSRSSHLGQKLELLLAFAASQRLHLCACSVPKVQTSTAKHLVCLMRLSDNNFKDGS